MRDPYMSDGDVTLYLGDCIEVMAAMPAESVDAVVCDPPYGLEFMGKDWDSFKTGRAAKYASGGSLTTTEFKNLGTLPSYTSRPAKRCGKCGKQAWFGSPCQCEKPEWVLDNSPLHAFAAWCETWAREAHRVLKPGGHLLAFGGTRTFHRLTCGIEDAGFEVRDCLSWLYGSGFPKSLDVSKAIDKAAGAERERYARPAFGGTFSDDAGTTYGTAISATPATDAAREWEGWGTALKPAWEPCVVARKPLTGTVAANVQAHGTGALNIDGCRIGMDGGTAGAGPGPTTGIYGDGLNGEAGKPVPGLGRWPANVALDEAAAAMLDAQSGEAKPKAARTARKGGNGGALGGFAGSSADAVGHWPADGGGGASRFYYVAKASKKDRTAGGTVENTHPTVKPTALMRWLVRMVTPPGGVVLDPFAGSGSTLVAAVREGFACIGIEREEEYAKIIAGRIAAEQPTLLGGM